MRDVEFRGWDVENKCWRYGSYQKRQEYTIAPLGTTKYDYDKSFIHYIIWDGFADWNMTKPCHRVEVDPKSLGQFVGTVDKDGTKIYEGDIVKWYEIGGHYMEEVVKWEYNLCGFYPVNSWRPSQPEVVGNTYEKETSEEVS